jgi:hypothetical protein
MKKIVLIGILMCGINWVQSQDLDLELHINSILLSPYKKVTPKGVQGDSAFLEYVINNVLESPEDKMFITNRELLTSLCTKNCREEAVRIFDSLERKKTIEVNLDLANFVADSHKIEYEGEDSLISAIDGFLPFGAVTALPQTQIGSLEIRWGKRSLNIPQEAYQDLFNPDFCEGNYFKRPIMAYLSNDKEYLYLYIFGGESSGMYFAKLIFDQRGYIKRIVVEYPELLRFGALRPDFLGF